MRRARQWLAKELDVVVTTAALRALQGVFFDSPAPPPVWPMVLHAAMDDPFRDYPNRAAEDIPATILPHCVWLLESAMRLRLRAVATLRRFVAVSSENLRDRVAQAVAAGVVPGLARTLALPLDSHPAAPDVVSKRW